MKHWLLAGSIALILGGCAHTPEHKKLSQLDGLQQALPGVYTSAAAGGSAGDESVSFTISPVTAQLIGEKVYFVRETPTDNAGLVLWQGIWTFVAVAPKGHRAGADPGIMQHSFLFKEPRRWASAGSNPDLLESMLPDDLQPLSGCDLLWQSIPMGYETQTLSGDCRPGRLASGLWIEQKAKLDGGMLTLTEQPLDSSGAPDPRAAPITLQLTRTGAPP